MQRSGSLPKKVPEMSHLRQNKPSGRAMLERHRSSPQAENLKLCGPKTDDASTSNGDANNEQFTSILKNPTN